MSDSPSKGEQTSQAILEAAYALFLEQGYHATSMRQIAKRANLALAGIYNHFASKEQIFESVLLEKHPYRKVLKILLAAPGDSFEQFAHNSAHAMLAELGNRPDFIKLAFIELSEFKGSHIGLLSQIIFPEIYPLVQHFKDHADGLRDLPMQTTLLSFIGTFISYIMISNLIAPTAFDPEDVSLERFVDIFLHGVIPPKQNSLAIPFKTPETERSERL